VKTRRTEVDSHPLPSRRDYPVKTLEEKKQLFEELKKQWKIMWRERIDDKVRAEGISDKDYSQLFVERGTVILATRKFKPLDFYEILKLHQTSIDTEIIPSNPSVGGWGRFIRSVLKPQKPARRRREMPLKPDKHSAKQQLKKSGRGWLHSKR